MGTDGEFDIDSGDGAGKFLIDDSGKFMICGECCEGKPCTDCIDDRPGATVVVTGSCTEWDGHYTCYDSDSNGGCEWYFEHDSKSGYFFILDYNLSVANDWYGRLRSPTTTYFEGAMTGACSGGGALSFSGTLSAGILCLGDTASVTSD